MKCDMVNKIEHEERKWQSLAFNIKCRLLSQIEEDLKRQDYKLQMHKLLNEARVNLKAFKKPCLPFIFLSQYAHVKSAMDLFEKLFMQQLEGVAHFEKQRNSDFSQIFRSQLLIPTEEKSYIEKVCMDIVKLSEEIPAKRTFGDMSIPTTENTTINTLRKTMELVLNRLVEINNKQIDTEQQIKEKCVSIANWTDLERNEMVQDNKTLQKQESKKSKIIQYNKELKIISDRITELQTSNGILSQQNFDMQKGYAQLQTVLHSLIQENASLTSRIMEKERCIFTLRNEKDDLNTRLSSVARDKLTKGIPDITDLGDPNRPMKISEMYGELYDNEWTDAMECTDDVKDFFKDMPFVDIDEILVHHLYKLLKV